MKNEPTIPPYHPTLPEIWPDGHHHVERHAPGVRIAAWGPRPGGDYVVRVHAAGGSRTLRTRDPRRVAHLVRRWRLAARDAWAAMRAPD